MKRAEIAFILAVTGFAVVFAGISLSKASAFLSVGVNVNRGGGGVAGKPRDLDAAAIKRLIRQRNLSDHEAVYYKRVEEIPAPPTHTDAIPENTNDTPNTKSPDPAARR